MKTNTEFVSDMMEYSGTGAVAQFFILDAIYKQAKHVSEISDKDIDEAFKENIMDGMAWKRTAIEIVEKFDNRSKAHVANYQRDTLIRKKGFNIESK